MRLTHGSLGAIEDVFGEKLVLSGRGLTPQKVASASQAKLNEVIELHEWASFWGALDPAKGTWLETYRNEIPGRLLIPAARTLNAGVSMAMYADTVLQPDPLNPANMHTVMKNASHHPFRKTLEYRVGILALLAPLVRDGKIVLASADLARAMAYGEYPYSRNPVKELNDELFVETQEILFEADKAHEEFERKHPIRFAIFGSTVSYDSDRINNMSNRLFALTYAEKLNADLFDLIRDGNQFPLPKDTGDFSMRRLTGMATLMMPGLERMPFGEILALAKGSEAAAAVRASIGPIFDALPPGLSDEESTKYLRQIAEERLHPELRRLEHEASQLPSAESWMGAAVGLTAPIVELSTTGKLGPASIASLVGAPLPMLAGWVAGKSDRQLARRTRRALATALPDRQLKQQRWFRRKR